MKKMSRRELLKGMGVAGAALATPQMLLAADGKSKSAHEAGKEFAGAANGKSRRPNIIFIMADQLSAKWVGCYGSGVASTPTLDRLAGKGIKFTRCITHAPACAPNRASIFTGRSLEIHGMVVNNLRLQTDSPLFTQVLQTHGYRTGGFGKFHFTEMPMYPHESMKRYGFDESVECEDPRWGAYLEWIARDHPQYFEKALALCWSQPFINEYGREVFGKKDLEGEYHRAAEKHLIPLKKASEWAMMYTQPLPAELTQSVFITDRSLDFIQRHQAQHNDQPYFCFISYVQPHDPYDPPAPYSTMFDPHDMKPAVPMVGDHYTCKLLESWRDVGEFRKVANNRDIVNKFRSHYHGNVRLIDDQIGRLMKYLEKTGQIDNTIIVFTTDHGEMLGDHGLICKWAMHYDAGIRVPLIVSGPGIAQGVVSDRLTSALDFFPTICDLANMELRPPLEGNSFYSTCQGKTGDKGWENMTVQLGAVRSIMTNDGWRITNYNQEGEGQMYNLREDPDEQRNLYHDSAWVKKRLELHERYVRSMVHSTDIPRYNNLPQKDGHRCLFNPEYTKFSPLPWKISMDMRGPGVVCSS